eukprot:8602723-Lingulodinium_polyedra.AAC.1
MLREVREEMDAKGMSTILELALGAVPWSTTEEADGAVVRVEVGQTTYVDDLGELLEDEDPEKL